MSRKMQTAMCLALILCCSHPELVLAQSQKSQIWQVPVLPKSGANSADEDSVFSPGNPGRSRRLEQLSEPLTSDRLNPGERVLDGNAASSAPSATELLGRLGVLSTGSESGRWGGGRLSLRGRPGSEPTVSVNGALLSSGFSGAHAEDLIPPVGIAQIRVYPFFPSMGLPRVGVGGGYDISLLSGRDSVRQESVFFVENPSAVGAAARTRAGCCLQVSWSSAFFRGQQALRDDGNTPQMSDDDRTIRTRFNEVSRVSSAATYQHDFGNGSRAESALIAGAEGRGWMGFPVLASAERQRLQRSLLFVSQEFSHLSPSAGWLARARLNGRRESGVFSQSLQNKENQYRSDLRSEDFVSADTDVMLPLSASDRPHRLLFFSMAEKNNFKSTISLVQTKLQSPEENPLEDRDSELSGSLVRIVLGGGIALEFPKEHSFKLESSQQWNSAKQSRICGVFAPSFLCSENGQFTRENSNSTTASWRYRGFAEGVFSVQAGRLSRSPTPVELAGRPDGVLANPNLKPEFTLATDIGYESRWGSATVYFARDKDLINAEQVNPLFLRYSNTSEAQRLGVSLEGDVALFGFEISAQAEKIWAELLRGRPEQRVVSFVPENRINLVINRKVADLLFQPERLFPVQMTFEVSRSGEYWLDSEGIARLSPPAIANLRVKHSVGLSEGQLEVSLTVRNIFNRAESTLILPAQPSRPVYWSDSPVLPIQGRAYELTLRLLSR